MARAKTTFSKMGIFLCSSMKEGEGKQLVECMICGVLVGSVFSYHKHNVRQHSLAQLSRAILKLRNLKLPLVDPMEEVDEGEDDDDEDVMGGRIKDPMDVLSECVCTYCSRTLQ